MPTLVLMRHANATPGNASLKDFDRPLSAMGWAEAKNTSILLQKTGLKIDHVFCSPANRTRETLEAFRQINFLNDHQINFEPLLYSGEVTDYENALVKAPSNAALLIVGHNPMVERFAFELAKTGYKTKLNQLKFGFPTAAIAVIETETSDLKHFLTAQ